MLRVRRELSESGFYHVTVRGNDRQIIFEEDRDRRMYLNYLVNAKGKAQVKIIAWCLMGNHVHLLMEDRQQGISKMMQSLSGAYAVYFNRKYGRVGHLFQDRFNSVPVGSDAQLLETVHYIHNNPVKAGMCQMEEYPWSSFSEYVCGGEVTDTALILEMLGGVDRFIEFSKTHVPAQDPVRPLVRRLSDDEALEIAKRLLDGTEIEDGAAGLKRVEAQRRSRILLELRDAGLSIRQIQSATGLGRRLISQSLSEMR